MKTANAQALGSKVRPGLVAVFVGGTAGIGEYTMKTFAKYAKDPHIYFVGRSEASGTRISSEIAKINPTATTRFIQADITKLATVDNVTAEILRHEKKLNILFLTAGFTRLSGREETSEGLDKKMSVHYYGRMRFVLNLLPLLQAAATDADTEPVGARVVSVLSPGTEGAIIEDDLELKHNWTLKNCAGQAVAFNSFAMETMADREKTIGWSHVYPSVVMTEYLRELPWAARVGAKLFMPFSVGQEECGEGMVNLLVSEKLRKGLALVQWDGESRDTRTRELSWLEKMSGGANGWWSAERRDLVWKHTMEVMGRVKPATDG